MLNLITHYSLKAVHACMHEHYKHLQLVDTNHKYDLFLANYRMLKKIAIIANFLCNCMFILALGLLYVPFSFSRTEVMQLKITALWSLPVLQFHHQQMHQ